MAHDGMELFTSAALQLKYRTDPFPDVVVNHPYWLLTWHIVLCLTDWRVSAKNYAGDLLHSEHCHIYKILSLPVSNSFWSGNEEELLATSLRTFTATESGLSGMDMDVMSWKWSSRHNRSFPPMLHPTEHLGPWDRNNSLSLPTSEAGSSSSGKHFNWR